MKSIRKKNQRTQTLSVMVMVGLLAGPFMTMIDSSIVNVALPDMMSELKTSMGTIQWVASAYLLALGITLTGTAYLAKKFGTRRAYIISLIGFTISSILCSISQNIEFLIIARIVQGIFGAPLVPLAMNMLFGKGKAEQQLPAVAGMILFLAPAVGPSLGGVLIHLSGWPLIFLANLPVGILAVIGAFRLPDEIVAQKDDKTRFDTPGFILLATGLAGLTYGASKGPQSGWFEGTVWPFWAIGILLLVAYVIWAIRREHPIVDITLIRIPQHALAISLTAIVAVVTFAAILLVPTFMQEIQGMSAIVAGLALLPQALITGIGTVLGNKMPERFGVRWTVVTGMLLLTISTVGLLALDTNTSVWYTAVILIGRGFAIGLVIQPLLNRLIKSLPEHKVPDGNTLFNVVQRVGGTLGIALILTFWQVRESARIKSAIEQLGFSNKMTGSIDQSMISKLPAPMVHVLKDAASFGFHDAIWLITCVSALGTFIALFIKKDKILQ